MGLSLRLDWSTIQRPKTQFNLGFFDTSPPPSHYSAESSSREAREEINVSSMGFAADNQRGSESFPKLRSQSGYTTTQPKSSSNSQLLSAENKKKRDLTAR